MAESMDPDVQDELQAMSGKQKPKESTFGTNRAFNTGRGDTKPAKSLRPMIAGENFGAPINTHLNEYLQSRRSLSPPPPLVLSQSEKVAKMELEAILKRPAHTPEDKFLVLDARDKLIRLTTAKNVDIKRASSTKGVCPDMCPEKERMSRESKHRVANFELKGDSKYEMNHAVAVKEYSRSSADQESPLPHELRPEPVLKLTMTYLLQNIMDLCDDPDTNICDWYHFLWDRTRSIRKDITQQELCSTETVLLVEQCARFHIHCAARLVAEEPQVFDQKINTENLTKCLQSLKYMYHDLGLKMVRCPNEAEFRAYVVLLNLNDSNFLWEVKQLREDIQKSPEIQFAIKVYLALETNNYVRFFSLVRSTTYMNACILLRYFIQVRVKALEVMFKAYAPRAAVYMSIQNLTYSLGFEDFQQCVTFLKYYNLKCDEYEDRVLLDRNSFFYPDLAFLLDRAINVVEHKRHSSVGEAVHGCPLDMKNVLDRYEPHNSFDDNGFLLSKAWTAEDQNYYKPEARIEARTIQMRAPTPPAFREDDGLFKMPMAPPKSSPKSRLSPKTVVTSDNTISSTSSTTTTSVFGSSKFTPTTQSLFKIPANQTPSATSIFGEFSQAAPQPNLFSGGFASTVSSTTQPQPSKPLDTADGSAFKFTNNATFGKPPENGANNLFGRFSQKTETSPFAPVKPTSNLFGNAAASNASSSIFGNFNKTSTDQSGFDGQVKFQMTPSSGASITSNLFSGFKGTSTAIPGVTPLTDQSSAAKDNELAKLKREKEEAILKEMERKKKEAEEIERKKKAELEEAERKRKNAEEEEKRKQLERKRLQIENTAKEFVGSIMEEFATEYVKEVAASEIEWHRAIEEATTNNYTELLHEVINSELLKIATNVKEVWNKNILEKYFAMWRMTARKKIEQRQKIANTPIWMPKKSREELIPELHHPLQSQTLELMKRYRSGLPSKLIAPPIRDDSIDLYSIVAETLIKLTEQNRNGKRTQNIYWKCVISVPGDEEDASSQSLSKWLDNVFYRQLTKFPRQSDIFFVEQHDYKNHRLNVCMRKLTGKKLLRESDENTCTAQDIEGTNAILFILSTKNLTATRARIKAVLQAIELNNSCALLIFNLDTHDLSVVKNALSLHEFMDYEKIEECVFANGLRGRSTNNLCNLIKLGLKYVAGNSFYDDQLEMQQTVSFLRICLADELWQRIYLSVNRNPTLLEASTQFQFLIDYHNEAIDQLVSVCTPSCIDNNPTLFPFELRQFVPKHELDIPLGLEYFPENWHKLADKHQRQLVEFLHSLKVHHQVDFKHITEMSAMEAAILKFVRANITSEFEAQRTVHKMIQHISAYLNPAQLNGFTFKQNLAKYSWLGAFPIFTTDFLSFRYQQYVKEQRLPDYVIYDKYEYHDYTRTAWWLQTNENLLKNITANVLRNIDVTVDEYEQTCKRQRLDDTLAANQEKQKMDDILAKGLARLAAADKTIDRMRKIQKTCKDISKDLDHDLYRQEIVMREMKDQLKHL